MGNFPSLKGYGTIKLDCTENKDPTSNTPSFITTLKVSYLIVWFPFFALGLVILNFDLLGLELGPEKEQTIIVSQDGPCTVTARNWAPCRWC